MSFRKYLVLACVVVFGAVGDVCLSRGMKDIGGIHVQNVLQTVAALLNPWVFVGTLLLIGFFAMYLTALSWADLTYVIPATSGVGYVLMALMAKYFLHEHVSAARWTGILVTTLGVTLLAGGPELTAHKPHEAEVVESRR